MSLLHASLRDRKDCIAIRTPIGTIVVSYSDNTDVGGKRTFIVTPPTDSFGFSLAPSGTSMIVELPDENR